MRSSGHILLSLLPVSGVEQNKSKPACFRYQTRRVLSGIVTVQCDFQWQCRMFQKELYNVESLYKFIQRACTVF
jgi:hypothetical protein